MSRRRRAVKRETTPDSKYGNVLVARFVSSLMKEGKKSLAERVFYDAVDFAAKKSQQDGLSVFKKAISNVKPSVEVKSRRIGGANYQIPIEVNPERRVALGIRWMIAAARARREKSMVQKLGAEFLAASNGEGAAIKKREDTHRMAEANKAFAHFRWR